MNSLKAFTCAALLSAVPSIALAQSDPGASGIPDPADMRVKVPVVLYQSPLDDYRVIADDADSPAKNWRTANDHVGKEGGMGGMDMSGDTAKHEHHQHGGTP